MKKGETGVVIIEHDIEMSNVSEIIVTLVSIVGKIKKRLSKQEVEIMSPNKLLVPLSQEDTIQLGREIDTDVKVEGQIIFNNNPPTVSKTDIVSFRLGSTLNTEQVPDANGSSGQYNEITIRFRNGTIYANVDPEYLESIVNEEVTKAVQNIDIISGADGKDGKDGVDGTDGKSAYQLAVENGYTGTETEWLESLHGTDGNNGQDGQNGADGKSAYEQAVEGGYTGTEAEFKQALASLGDPTDIDFSDIEGV